MFEAANISQTPYPGLRPFKRDEFDIFFGRDRHVDAMIEKLEAERFLCVTGPSGCGKSSLARTGLFNALEAGFLEGYGSDWVFCDFRPGDVPIHRLSEALSHAILTGDSSSAIDPNLLDDKDALASFFRNHIASSSSDLNPATQKAVALNGRPVIILVDQFEEIFRYAQADPHEAARFVDVLLKTAQAQKDIFVVITIRTDELAKCARYEGLTSAINDSQFLTPTLDRFQMQEAIEGPVTLFGGQIDNRLTVFLLNALEEQLDKLPLMQHALKLLYAHKKEQSEEDDFVIDKADFIEVFGLKKDQGLSDAEGKNVLNLSLSNRLDGIFRDLKPKNLRPIARRVFTALTNIDSQGRDIRNPMRLDVLAATSGASIEQTKQVIRAFSAGSEAYLQPPGDTALDDDTIIDVTHECVLRLWTRLRGKWIAGEQSNAENIRLLARLARDREAAVHSSKWDRFLGSGLLRGHALQSYSKWWRMFDPSPTWAAQYIEHVRWQDKNDGNTDLGTNEKFERVEGFFNKSQSFVKRLRNLAVAASLACVGLLVFSAYFYVQGQNAELALAQQETQRKLESARLKAEEDERRIMDAVKNSVEPTPNALTPLTTIQSSLEVSRLAETLPEEGGEWIAAMRKLWLSLVYAHEKRRFVVDTRTNADAQVQSAKFAFDGTRVVAITSNGDLIMWQADDPETRLAEIKLTDFLTFNSYDHRVPRSLDVAADGRTAVVGMRRGGVLLIDLETFETHELYAGPDPAKPASVMDVTFSTDGTMIAASSLDKVARVWTRTPDGTVMGLLDGWALTHEVSPGQQRDLDRRASEEDGTYQNRLDRASIWSVGFSSDNAMLAMGMRGGEVCIYSLVLGTTGCSSKGHGPDKVVKAVDFLPGSRKLVSGGNDDSVVVWDPALHDVEGIKLSPSGGRMWLESDVWDIAFDPEGDMMAAIAWDGSISVFETGTWRPVVQLHRHDGAPRTVSYDPSGKYLLSGAYDRTARIWAPMMSLAEDDRYSFRLPSRNSQAYREIESIAFSSDGAFLAATDKTNVYVKPDIGPRVELKNPEEGIIFKDVAVGSSGAVIASAIGGKLFSWQDLMGKGQGASVSFSGVPRHTAINDVSTSRSGDLAAFALKLADGSYSIAVCETPTPATPVCDVSAGAGGALIETSRSRLPPPVEGEKDVLSDCRKSRFFLQSVALSADGARVAAGTGDCAVQVFEVSSPDGPPTYLTGHVGSIVGLGFNAAGTKLVTASSDWWGSVFDIETGARIELSRGHGSRLTDAVFAPDGDRVATVSLDETMVLWNSILGVNRLTVPGHRSNIMALDAIKRPDGSMYIATGTSDGEVSVFPYFVTSPDLQAYAKRVLEGILGTKALPSQADGI